SALPKYSRMAGTLFFRKSLIWEYFYRSDKKGDRTNTFNPNVLRHLKITLILQKRRINTH
ncbi:hypothetical protein, partial [Nostoc sp. NMS9]|uniref:hypothetical protein n=1 Tax=Nostoc sp. NMS9 TaxID=2815393 RepID=UPI0025F4A42D